ncbi:hypothetical protein CL614_02840 [archaeon]|nr:hypothetical protein [archaeon]|tara:strand:+ start:4665 stop:5252 length:588 start_codon:yes stop_codon:yes gene_type:complete
MSETRNIEKIEKNWVTFEKLCKRLSDSSLNNLLESLGERIVMCPASSRLDQYNCEPGGMVQHVLDTTMTMRTLNDALGYNIAVAPILKTGLLHDLGKVGDLDNDYFIEQESEWHREKLGQHYVYNDKLQKMSVSHRTLYILQSFGVRLTPDEWLAIQLASGPHFEENRFYVHSEPTLALLLQHAKSVSIHVERNR